MLPVFPVHFVLPSVAASLATESIPYTGMALSASGQPCNRLTPDGVPYRSTDEEFTSEELATMRDRVPDRPADSVQARLTSYSNAAVGNAAARYLEALNAGHMDRLRSMLETDIKVMEATKRGIK